MLGVPVDEEERWLDALEKGELDDNGELKKEIDESLLTARQVRRMHRCLLFAFYFTLHYCYYYFFFFLHRKPCYTSSRASHCWSSPWATKRRR